MAIPKNFEGNELTHDGRITYLLNEILQTLGGVVSSQVLKFGKAPDFDIADGFVTIWDGANDGAVVNQMRYIYSTSAIIDTMSSSEIADNQIIEVQGLDENYELVIQNVTLNGRNKVTLGTSLIRVFRMRNIGSSDLQGDVYCYEDTAIVLGRPTDSTKIRAIINIDSASGESNNQTLMAVYTVPAGKTAYVNRYYSSIANAEGGFFGDEGASDIRLFVRPEGEVFQIKHDNTLKSNGNSYISQQWGGYLTVEEKSDIELRANTSVNQSAISGGFDIVLVDN